MFSKKIKIVIVIVIFLSLTAILFFVLKNRNNEKFNNNSDSSVQPLKTGKNDSVSEAPEGRQQVATNTETIIEKIDQPENIDQAKFLAELKAQNPEYSPKQIEFYGVTAAKKEMVPCLGRKDETNCIAAVAFVTRADGFCGEINNKNSQLECSDIILNDKALVEINKCETYSPKNKKAQCLINIFNLYKQPEDCAGLISVEVKKMCENSVTFQIAVKKQNKQLCESISHEYIRIYCLEDMISKLLDSDSDGLNDQDEISKYHTNPLKADTDGDGFQDGEEINNGYDPNGPGLLPGN